MVHQTAGLLDFRSALRSEAEEPLSFLVDKVASGPGRGSSLSRKGLYGAATTFSR